MARPLLIVIASIFIGTTVLAQTDVNCFDCDFCIPEVSTTPAKGMAEFFKGIANEFKRPSIDWDGRGKVFVEFAVDIDSAIIVESVRAVAGTNEALNGAVVESVRASKSKWTPALKHGRPVKQRTIIVVAF